MRFLALALFGFGLGVLYGNTWESQVVGITSLTTGLLVFAGVGVWRWIRSMPSHFHGW
jgi:hypothetical protein